MVITARQADVTVITLIPNRSANGRQLKLFFLPLAAISLLIATFWTFMGAWVVLPFAGLEVGLLAFILHRVWLFNQRQQQITLKRDTIAIDDDEPAFASNCLLQRSETRLSIANSPAAEVDEVCLFDTAHRVELGGFLNNSDKQLVVTELKGEGLPVFLYVRADSSM
ncbi:DUF2244 domain-containing protein [Halioxenophilus sp. WMMB6]|uniref:DUF2244 domain-containing protein n=1 Tax=Halioxenophilus sp. WMMB6 TaxID=3073815 RepID=UPI00295F393A|nr:DUF2244 domain-containing protein [Halioxenophilus sp. WMMB6]